MDLKLAGKTALVTGASKGIGKAISRSLAAERCNLVLVARTKESLGAWRGELSAQSDARIDIAAADFSKGSEIDRIANEYPEIDILINNAGAIGGGELLEVTEAQWREWWDLKVFGYINATRAYYRLMKARGTGVIINVIGSAANSKPPTYICGTAGNAALDAFTRSLGSVSHKDGVRVIGIHPGAVETERLIEIEQQGVDLNRNAMPFGRPAFPHEIAATVAFLASDLSTYTSGSILTIDGGLSASGG